tara:strand:- start:31 stop:645 length:615 start_codon:yes stop_codon:yes gene_type:complete
MIGLIDAKSGNIGSMENALEYLGIKYLIIEKKSQFNSGMSLILPGIGSFHTLMNNLNKLELVNPIKKAIDEGSPFLGICVGMQVLLSTGLEQKKTTGLEVINGQVVKINNLKMKVPVISWIKVRPSSVDSINYILKNCKELNFYFSHSFYCEVENPNEIVAHSEYNQIRYPAIINRDNIYGVQFHPEKSRQAGLQIIKNFSEIN